MRKARTASLTGWCVLLSSAISQLKNIWEFECQYSPLSPLPSFWRCVIFYSISGLFTNQLWYWSNLLVLPGNPTHATDRKSSCPNEISGWRRKRGKTKNAFWNLLSYLSMLVCVYSCTHALCLKHTSTASWKVWVVNLVLLSFLFVLDENNVVTYWVRSSKNSRFFTPPIV